MSDSHSELDTPDEAADARAELIGQLFREHNSALLRFLRNRLRSKEEAADVAQEAYVRILRLDSPGTLSYMRASLFTIAAHIAIDRLRSRQVQARISALRFFDEATNDLSPEQEASDAEDVRLLKAYINELPPLYREALYLYRFEALTTEEVGARMGLPGRTVRHYISEALVYCQTRLERGARPKQAQASE